MSIIHKLKRAFAMVATFALLATTGAPVAFAQTFNDVATDAWFFDYVEQLVDEGVFDVSDNFRPADALNRAELVKIVITAIDGLAGYEAPATPTFDDVPADAWFFDYVEAAVQLDIVNGYTDASGNLTGMFGPSDTVNRAASTKILVNAFSVPTDLDPAAPFADVPESAWFYEYVTTAYNQSVVDGYDNGMFGPADPVTRAQVAKLTVNAQDPFAREVAEETPAETPAEETPAEAPVVTSDGDLEISLNDGSSAGSTLPFSATNVGLATFDLTAADDDVTITNLAVTRGGVGQVGDWNQLFLYEGPIRLTTGRTINNDTNVATFPVNLTVPAGTTRTIRLVGEVAASGTASANNQHYFYLASAADVASNAQSAAGDFPIAGSTFTIGGVSVNTLTITAGSTPAQPLIGASNVELGSFKTAAGSTNDVTVHEVTLTQNGSLSAERMVNLRLLRGNDEVAATPAFGDKERVTFVLDTPFLVPEGQTKTWYVRGDLDGGDTNDTIQLYLDETTDFVAVDQQYGHGAAITNTLGTSNVSAVNLKGGKVTITDNGPSAAQIAQNVTNIELLNYSITTDRDLTVRDATVTLQVQDSSSNQPDIDADLTVGSSCTISSVAASGTNYDITASSDCADDLSAGDMATTTVSGTTYYMRVVSNDLDASDGGLVVASGTSLTSLTSGTIVEDNPYAYIKDLRVLDLDTGGTLQGPLTLASQGTKSATSDSVYRKTFTEDYELTKGETRHLSIQVNTDQYLPAGYQVLATISYSTSDDAGATATAATGYIKDFNANENVANADIVGDSLTGKAMTVASNSLSIGLASSPNPSNTSFIKGQTGVKAVGFNFTAGDAGDITIKKIILRAVGDDDGDFDQGAGTGALGDTAAQDLISSISLYHGNDLIGEAEGLTLVSASGSTFTSEDDYYKSEFEDLNVVVPAGSSITLTAQVNLQSALSATRYVAIYLDADADVTAEDKDANSITATETDANSDVASEVNGINSSDSHDRVVQIDTSGTLTVREQSSPQASIVVAGATQQMVAQYEFASSKEAFDVHELTVLNDLSSAFDTETDTSAVEMVWIEYPDVNGVMQTASQTLVAGSANFSGLNPALYVAKDDVAVVKVYADVQTTDFGQTLTGQRFRLGVQDDNADSSDGTFRAFGEASGEAEYNPSVTGAANVYEHIVRFTKPTITLDGSGSLALTSSKTDLYAAKVTADAARGLEVKRLVFQVDMQLGAAADSLSNFRIRQGLSGTDLSTAEATIYGRSAAGAGAVDLHQTTTDYDVTNSDASDGTFTGQVVVTFTTARTIAAGSSKTFVLSGEVSGASATGEQISAYIADDTVNGFTGSAGTASLFQGCFYFEDPSAGATDAVVYVDLNCDGDGSDSGEYTLDVQGTGDGSTGVTAETTTDLTAAVGDGALSGALAVYDPDTGTDDDHYFWFDEDTDGVLDTNEVVISRHTEATDINIDDATGATGFSDQGSYAYVDVGGGLVLHDFDSAAGVASLCFEATAGNRAIADPSTTEICMDLVSETDDLTGADDVLVGTGTMVNFLWSDKSRTSPAHSELTVDWASGYLVDTLSSPTRVFSY